MLRLHTENAPYPCIDLLLVMEFSLTMVSWYGYKKCIISRCWRLLPIGPFNLGICQPKSGVISLTSYINFVCSTAPLQLHQLSK